MQDYILKAEHLTKVYQVDDSEVTVITDVSFCIEPGELVMIAGPSGSGKSTLLYMLGGLRKPSSGQIWYNNVSYQDLSDQALTKLRYDDFGFVLQQHFLIPYLNCVENVCLARSKTFDLQAKELLTELGLARHFGKTPNTLSYGERQRVALARGLVHQPQLLFADEPTAAVNAELAKSITAYIKTYCEQGGACIMVTHDTSLFSQATRVLTLIDGQLS